MLTIYLAIVAVVAVIETRLMKKERDRARMYARWESGTAERRFHEKVRAVARGDSIIGQCRLWKREAKRQRAFAVHCEKTAWANLYSCGDYAVAIEEWKRKYNLAESSNQELALRLAGLELKLMKRWKKKAKLLKVQT